MKSNDHATSPALMRGFDILDSKGRSVRKFFLIANAASIDPWLPVADVRSSDCASRADSDAGKQRLV